MKYLFATTNKAKIRYYANKLQENGIDIVTLDDLNITIDVEETGNDPVENALIKAETYFNITKLPTIAIDDGLYLNDIPDNIQPGTFVRRVNGKRLNDQEMLDYYIDLVNKYGHDGYLDGYFLKGIAIFYENNHYTYEYKSDTTLINKTSSKFIEGYPLSSLQYHKEKESSMKENKQKEIVGFIMDTISFIESKDIKEK